MFLFVAALLRRSNVYYNNRVVSEETNTFKKLNMSTGVPEENAYSNTLCFYLDYESSVTLTLNGNEYVNPLFYCPKDAEDVKFEPDDAEIYYTPLFELSASQYNSMFKYVNSIYITTKKATFTTPSSEFTFGGSDPQYYDLVVLPLPSWSAEYSASHNIVAAQTSSYIFVVDDDKNSISMTIKPGSSSSYTIKNGISGRCSIEFPQDGPYAYTGVCSDEGISKSMIIAISAGAASGFVLICVSVFCVYWFLIRDNKKDDSGNDKKDSEKKEVQV